MRFDRENNINTEAASGRPASKSMKFLEWLRGWPFDWVSLVMFVCVFIASMLIFLPLSRGDASLAEALTGKGTIFNPEVDDEGGAVRLSKDMSLLVADESSPLYEYFMSGDRVNILLIGINDNMSDTIMLATYDMEDQKIDIIAIPRDTHYYRGSDWGNYAFHKINSVYRTEGIVTLAQYVSSLLYGIPINYYVTVDYDAVVKIMDAVGGVKINIPFHMKYDDTTKGHELHIDIPAGLQTIDSTNVMQFLRFRKANPSYAAQGYQSYPGGDIQRIEMQQEFIKAVIKECLRLKNLGKVTDVALECIKSDLTYNAAAAIVGRAMSGLDGDAVDTHVLPGEDRLLHEFSFWVSDEGATLQLLEDIFIPASEPETPEGQEGNPGGGAGESGSGTSN